MHGKWVPKTLLQAFEVVALIPPSQEAPPPNNYDPGSYLMVLDWGYSLDGGAGLLVLAGNDYFGSVSERKATGCAEIAPCTSCGLSMFALTVLHVGLLFQNSDPVLLLPHETTKLGFWKRRLQIDVPSIQPASETVTIPATSRNSTEQHLEKHFPHQHPELLPQGGLSQLPRG